MESGLLEFDNAIYSFLVMHRNPVLTNIMKVITELGGAFILIIVAILCVVLIKDKKYKVMVPINLAVVAGFNVILKNIFDRPRPDMFRIIEADGFSFPSGHSMASMAFYGYLIYIIWKKVENKKLRNCLCVFLSLLILAIGFSRVYLGVHYASDVIAGLCISAIYLILCISLGIYK